jgi:recombination protein RecA
LAKDKTKTSVKGMAWEVVAAGLEKSLGEGSFFNMGASPTSIDIDVIPSELITLDEALGVYGFPRGRIIEIYGPESSGKTSLVLLILAQAQKIMPGRPMVYIDLEHALERTWMEKIGVSMEGLWVCQPSGAEEALNAAETAIESAGPGLVIIDSIASLSPQAEVEGQVGDSFVGVNARLMGQFMRKAVPATKKNDVTLFCINQIRSGIGPYAGETRPGGNALRFFASQVIRTRKSKEIISNGVQVGQRILCQVKKNKVASPAKSAEIPLLFGKGFSKGIDLIDVAAEAGIVEKLGTWYAFEGEKIGQGSFNAGLFLEANEDIFQKIYKKYKTLRTGEGEQPDDEI